MPAPILSSLEDYESWQKSVNVASPSIPPRTRNRRAVAGKRTLGESISASRPIQPMDSRVYFGRFGRRGRHTGHTHAERLPGRACVPQHRGRKGFDRVGRGSDCVSWLVGWPR